MLIIAQPKSASTSLLWTLATVLNVAIKNGQSKRRNDKKCPGYSQMQTYHGTTVQRSHAYLKKYILSRGSLYKEHILPINEHLDIMREINKPIVVLLRDPLETIESYKRVFSVLPELDIDIETLEIEIKLFYNIYKNLGNPFLIVTYRDVVLNTKETLEKIIKYYGLKVPDLTGVKLDQRNYTGHGVKKLVNN